MKKPRISVCVCTYRRPQRLKELLEDLLQQSLLPQSVFIIDGYPGDQKVKKMLCALLTDSSVTFYYVPSNHANLAYQRFIGWKVASQSGSEFLLYLDDDLRLPDAETLVKLSGVLNTDKSLVGVTVNFKIGQLNPDANVKDLTELRSTAQRIVSKWPLGNYYKQGGLTPVGDRLLPNMGSKKSWVTIEWLRGGVMFLRLSSIDQDCFDENLFSLTAHHCGLGEDTCFSRRLSKRGNLALLKDLIVEHPGLEQPNSYPIKAYEHGFARAYSRRFINDCYRYPHSPKVLDRLFLLKFYIGHICLNLIRALTHFKKYYYCFALGFAVGALKGVVIKPNSKNLCPNINWFNDAEDSTSKAVVMKPVSCDD